MLIETRKFCLSVVRSISPRQTFYESYKHEIGGGRGWIIGPLQIDVSPPWSPTYETLYPPPSDFPVESCPSL